MALPILAGFEQAGAPTTRTLRRGVETERAIGGALPTRKAIAEVPDSGDRPDAPPLEERGNATFSGARLGRYEPPFGQFEGAIRVSSDGSRILVYRFLADIFEVLDGNDGDARRLGVPVFLQRDARPESAGIRRES